MYLMKPAQVQMTELMDAIETQQATSIGLHDRVILLESQRKQLAREVLRLQSKYARAECIAASFEQQLKRQAPAHIIDYSVQPDLEISTVLHEELQRANASGGTHMHASSSGTAGTSTSMATEGVRMLTSEGIMD
jgi:hypothetical protein